MFLPKKIFFFWQVSPKSFVDPRTCLSIFNHYCLLPLPRSPLPPGGPPRNASRDAADRPPGVEVDRAVATVHHYRRRCELKGGACATLLAERTRDDTALRFLPQLLPRVEKVLNALGVRFAPAAAAAASSDLKPVA